MMLDIKEKISIKYSGCLVLNADYSPMRIISWQKALIYYYKSLIGNDYDAIEVIDFYTNEIRTASNQYIRLPAVIKIKKYINMFGLRVKFSRKNLYARDNFTCQYCGLKKDINHLTYDHVIPKSQWSSLANPTSWTNIVTACVSCNFKKKNRTPEQAQMPLLNKPQEPSKHYKYLHNIQLYKFLPSEWQPFIHQ